MSRTLEYVIKALLYLAGAFAGVWVSNLLMGIDANPFTKALPFAIALILVIYSLSKEEER
ncbi:nuclease [Staphylococcus phage PG-2021_76]